MKLTPGVDFPNFRIVNDFVKRNNKEGIFVDGVKFEARVGYLREKEAAILKRLIEEVGQAFNPNSGNEVHSILVNKYGVPEDKLMHHNKTSVNAEVLKRVNEKRQLEFIDDLIEIRKVRTSLRALVPSKGNKESKAVINYLHPTKQLSNDKGPMFKFTPRLGLANTSRYQYSEPNLVGMSPEISDILCAPEGYYMVWVDVKQQEPSIFFEGVLNCEPIKKVFKKTGDRYLAIAQFCTHQDKILNDIEEFVEHKGITRLTEADWVYPYLMKIPGSRSIQIAKDQREGTPIRNLYNIDYKELNSAISEMELDALEISDELRDLYKVAIISGGYGASKGTLINLAGYEVGCAIYHMLETLPEMIAYKERTQRFVGANGNQVRTVFSTVLKLEDHDVKTGKKFSKNKIGRLALNYPTQGTGADLLKFAIMGVEDWKKDEGYTDEDIRLAFTKHDEHIFYVKQDMKGAIDKLTDIISVEVGDWAPIGVEVSYGTHYNMPLKGDWGRCHTA